MRQGPWQKVLNCGTLRVVRDTHVTPTFKTLHIQ